MALASLGVYAKEQARQAADRMENPEFRVMAFAELPPWVIDRLSKLREGFLSLGFRDLVTYTRRSQRTNYSCVLRSDDGERLAHVWVARFHGPMHWLMLLNGWSTFRRELRVEGRYGVSTDFPGGRRFETSPVEILAKAEVPGEMEFLIVPAATELAEVLERHGAGARAFAARAGIEPVRVTTEEQFFEIERALLRRVARRLRQQAAG